MFLDGTVCIVFGKYHILCSHTRVNGVTIVHSHPFKKGAAHKHSTVELLLVHFLSHLTTDGAAVVFALSLFIPFLLWRLHGITQHTHYYSPYHGVVALRAPPAIRFSVI